MNNEDIEYKLVEHARPAEVKMHNGLQVPVYGSRRERRAKMQEVKRALKKNRPIPVKYDELEVIKTAVDVAKLEGRHMAFIDELTYKQAAWLKKNNYTFKLEGNHFQIFLNNESR